MTSSIAQSDWDAFFTHARLGHQCPIIKDCARHCDVQKTYEQKSWKDLAFDNKITIITLIACSAIACVAVPTFKLTALVVIPMLYTLNRVCKVEGEASTRVSKTRCAFLSVFIEYDFLKPNEGQHDSIASFLQDWKPVPRRFYSLQELAKITEIVSTYGDEHGLGSLAQKVFMQLIKDQQYAYKMKKCKNACKLGISSVVSIALAMDNFLGPYSFLSSKPLVALLTGFSLFAGKQAVNAYQEPTIEEKRLNEFLPITHDADLWLGSMQEAGGWKKKKQLRAEIFAGTQKACKNGFIVGDQYTVLDSVTKDDMQKRTKLYASTTMLSPIVPCVSTTIEVVNKDTIDLAIALKNSGYNPVAINMANENHPGGGAKTGAAAQEESLFRRSNYHQSLYLEENFHLRRQMSNNTYRIPENGVIYSPNVQVFRAGEEKGFAFTDPEQMSFIAIAAYNLKDFDLGFSSTDHYKEGMRAKIRSYLRVAYLENHDAVVLGALGCGAFGNKPADVAEFFKQVLQESEFTGRFKKIAFAVIDDRNGTNFKPFSDVLHEIQI